MKSFAGFAGYISSVSIDWTIALVVAAAAVLGSLGGAALVSRVPSGALRKWFAWFVVVMAVFILAQEVPRLVGASVGDRRWWLILALLTLPAAGGGALTIVRAVRWRLPLPAPGALAPARPPGRY